MESIKKERFPKIDPYTFNRKRYKKGIRKSFDSYLLKCRFALDPEKKNLFQDQVLEIKKILTKTLSNVNTFEIGNIYFIFAVFDSHAKFLSDAADKCGGIDRRALPQYHSIILEKQEEFIDLLKQNNRKPISDIELEEFVNSQEADDASKNNNKK